MPLAIFFKTRATDISKAVYLSAAPFNEAPPADVIQRINRVRLAQRFGWTLDYIDKLDPFDIADILGVLDGEAKLEKRAHK